MPYPREYCGLDVVAETVELQILSGTGGQKIVVHLRSGRAVTLTDAINLGYIPVGSGNDYLFSAREKEMIRTEFGNPPSRGLFDL
jgi:hypothetical protein